MEIINTEIEGLKIVKLKVFGDDRGFFVEKFKFSEFEQNGLPTSFVQENHSRSMSGVVRGLHYQFDPPQGKLVGCTRGKIYDVAVDIRKDSKTFGQWVGVELDRATLFWIPAGFAHGFSVIGNEDADMVYKITDGEYNPQGEGGIMYNDEEFNIDWRVNSPVVSDRDRKQKSFDEYKKDPKF